MDDPPLQVADMCQSVNCNLQYKPACRDNVRWTSPIKGVSIGGFAAFMVFMTLLGLLTIGLVLSYKAGYHKPIELLLPCLSQRLLRRPGSAFDAVTAGGQQRFVVRARAPSKLSRTSSGSHNGTRRGRAGTYEVDLEAPNRVFNAMAMQCACSLPAFLD